MCVCVCVCVCEVYLPAASWEEVVAGDHHTAGENIVPARRCITMSVGREGGGQSYGMQGVMVYV